MARQFRLSIYGTCGFSASFRAPKSVPRERSGPNDVLAAIVTRDAHLPACWCVFALRRAKRSLRDLHAGFMSSISVRASSVVALPRCRRHRAMLSWISRNTPPPFLLAARSAGQSWTPNNTRYPHGMRWRDRGGDSAKDEMAKPLKDYA